MNTNFNKKYGFTLVELIFVLFLIALLFSLSLVYFNSKRYKLKQDVYLIYTNFVKAKNYALRYRQIQRIQFITDENKYIVSLTDTSGNHSYEFHLSDGVVFSNVRFGGGTTVIFYPNGFCMPSGSVYLKTVNSSHSEYRIKITMAGDIQIYKWDGTQWIR